MQNDLRLTIIRIVTFLGGLFFFIEYVMPPTVAKDTGWSELLEPVTSALTVLGVMAIGLGILNLLLVHGKKTVLQLGGWINSAALLFGMFATLTIMCTTWINGLSVSREVRQINLLGQFAERIIQDEKNNVETRQELRVRVEILLKSLSEKIQELQRNAAARSVGNTTALSFTKDVDLAVGKVEEHIQISKDALVTGENTRIQDTLVPISSAITDMAYSYNTLMMKLDEGSWAQSGYKVVYEGLFIPLGSAMFALLGIYIASAAFRAFRVRSLESGLLMAAAFLVILGQISFGTLVYEHMPSIRQWLLEVPNSAAFRAIRLGAGVGGLLLAIRMWLSIESRTFSGSKS